MFSMDVDDFEREISVYFESYNIDRNRGLLTGFIHEDCSFIEFKKKLKELGYIFSVRNSSVMSKENPAFSRSGIPCTGNPYTICDKIFWTCSLGKKYYKCPKEADPLYHIKNADKGFRSRISKKLNCPAKMVTTKLRYFVDFRIPTNKSNRTWRERKKMLDELRKLEAHQLRSVYRHYITLSLPDVHNHSCILKSVDQPGPVVRVYARRAQIIAQDAMHVSVDRWADGGRVYFRPFCLRPDGNAQSFLFCYQSEWQQRILRRYGSLCMLDGMHRTIGCPVPIYLLTTKTNSGYCTVGVCVVQNRSTKQLAEGLRVFAEWNIGWRPKFMTIDLNRIEMHAVADAFGPDVKIFACDYHREHTWNRRLMSRHFNIVKNQSAIMAQWRAIARSASQQEYNTNMKYLNSMPEFRDNFHLRQYFYNRWIAFKKQWVSTFLDTEFIFRLTAIDGVSTLHRFMEHKPISKLRNVTVYKIVNYMLESYFPDMFEQYSVANILSLPPYDDSLPPFLNERPPYFAQHVYQRYVDAQSTLRLDDVKAVARNLYIVQSEADHNLWHAVNYDCPSCTCADFNKWKLPCKHICALILYVKGCEFDDLPEWYLNDPLFTSDPLAGIRFDSGDDSEFRYFQDFPTRCDSMEHGVTEDLYVSSVDGYALMTEDGTGIVNEYASVKDPIIEKEFARKEMFVNVDELLVEEVVLVNKNGLMEVEEIVEVMPKEPTLDKTEMYKTLNSIGAKANLIKDKTYWTACMEHLKKAEQILDIAVDARRN